MHTQLAPNRSRRALIRASSALACSGMVWTPCCDLRTNEGWQIRQRCRTSTGWRLRPANGQFSTGTSVSASPRVTQGFEAGRWASRAKLATPAIRLHFALSENVGQSSRGVDGGCRREAIHESGNVVRVDTCRRDSLLPRKIGGTRCRCFFCCR